MRPSPNSLQRDTAKFHRQGARAIPNHYIVVLDEDVSLPDKFGVQPDVSAVARRADEVMRVVGAVPTYVYEHAIHGFAAQMTEEEALKLSEDDRVAFVEEDSVVEAIVTQNNPPWGLDRIGQRDLPLNADLLRTRPPERGVNAYIIDTGIRRTHTQFGGRAFAGFDAIGDGRTATIAMVMARTWPARSADRPTASRRACGCLRCASSAAAARAPTRGSSRE